MFWHSLLSIALISAICLLAYKLVSREQFDRIDYDLGSHERQFFRTVFSVGEGEDELKSGPPTAERFRSTLKELKEDGLSEVGIEPYFMAIWDDETGEVIYLSTETPEGVSMPARVSDKQRTIVDQGSYRMRVRGHPAGAITMVGRDISEELASLQQFRIVLALSGVGIWVVAILGSWWLAGRALKPIQSISETATRIAEGNLRERIKVSSSDSELDQLGVVLNSTFERLASSIERQKNFTSDASHELRTPLTIILSESQRGMKNERSAEQYRAILGNCNTAAKRMQGIIESLLLLARQDQNEGQEMQVVDLAETTQCIAELLQSEASASNHLIKMELSKAPILANQELLGVVVQNLISNAIYHTPEGSVIRLKSYAEEGASGEVAVLEVHDDGHGIAESDQAHLFERFYRVDAARTQTGGHSGLGLAIVKTITESHQGGIELISSPAVGTTFKLKFPKVS